VNSVRLAVVRPFRKDRNKINGEALRIQLQSAPITRDRLKTGRSTEPFDHWVENKSTVRNYGAGECVHSEFGQVIPKSFVLVSFEFYAKRNTQPLTYK